MRVVRTSIPSTTRVLIRRPPIEVDVLSRPVSGLSGQVDTRSAAVRTLLGIAEQPALTKDVVVPVQLGGQGVRFGRQRHPRHPEPL